MGKWTVKHLMPDDILKLDGAYLCDRRYVYLLIFWYFLVHFTIIKGLKSDRFTLLKCLITEYLKM